MVVFNRLLTVSLFSASRGEKNGYFYERCPEDYVVFKRPAGNVKLECSGGLDYLVGGEVRSAFPALLKPGSVDGSYCRIDNVDIEHLRGRHLEFDPECKTCTSMTMRGRQHRKQDSLTKYHQVTWKQFVKTLSDASSKGMICYLPRNDSRKHLLFPSGSRFPDADAESPLHIRMGSKVFTGTVLVRRCSLIIGSTRRSGMGLI